VRFNAGAIYIVAMSRGPACPSTLLVLVFVVVATAISHRYWEFQGAMRVSQEINFDKNLCIFGGFILMFPAGAGRFSVDGLRRGRTNRPS